MSEFRHGSFLFVPRRESNPNQKFRKLLFYPLNYKGKLIAKILLFSEYPNNFV